MVGMSQLDNSGIIYGSIYPALTGIGLKQNREKFTLPAAGHRGYSVDVGSSYGEVAIRIIDNAVPVETIRITDPKHIGPAIDAVMLNVQRKKAALQEAVAKSLANDEGYGRNE